MNKLSDIVDALPAQEIETVEIDISQQIGEPAKTTIFTYQAPTAAQLFQAGKTGKLLAARNPEMTDEMGAMVATMALSHVSPQAEKPALLYAKLAMKNGKLFMWLLGKFLEAFPHLQNMEATTEAAKKLSSLE